jgi:signal transduction histidine kinase/ligand-binding sensor domain-containing protein
MELRHNTAFALNLSSMRLLLVTLVLYTCFTQALYAQNDHFIQFDSRSGLSQNTVTKVLRDNDGLLWFGTQDGLNLYDGYSFVVFRQSKNDTNSLPDNYVLDIADDGRNRIWIGTRNGLCYYNKLSGRIHRFKVTDDIQYKTYHEVKLLKVQSDTLHFHASAFTSGAILTTSDKPVLLRSSAANRTPYTIGITPSGYFKFEPGKVFFESGTASKRLNLLDTISHLSKWKVYRDELFITSGNEILIYAAHSEYKKPRRRLVFNSTVSDFCIDNSGNLWVGSFQGLLRTDTQGQFTKYYQHHPSDPFSIPQGEVLHVSITNDNILWVGVNGKGAAALNLNSIPLAAFSPLYFESVINNDCWSFCHTANGMLLPGENGFGWMPGQPGAMPPKWLSGIQTLEFPTCCIFNGSKLCIGTRASGLYVYDTLTQKLDKKEIRGTVPFVNTVTHLMITRTGKLWVATHDACFESDAAMNNFTMRYDSYVLHTMEDRNENIWIASTNGLVKFDPKSGKVKLYSHEYDNPKSISSQFCSFTLEDRYGKFWVATLGGGLNIFDPVLETFSSITTEQGLPNNVVYALCSDAMDNIWMSTNEGVAIYLRNNTIRCFSTSDGLNSNEFISGSVTTDAEGHIWFGSVLGPVRFDPVALASTFEIALPVLTSFRVNDRFFTRGSDNILRLDPHQRNIHFTFSACDVAQQHHYGFLYKLEGFDSQWRDYLPGKQEINYTNLPFGEYTIRLRACLKGNPSVFKEQITHLIIAPYLWEQTWFQVIAILISSAMIIYLTRYVIRRRFRKRIEQMELQQKIHNERERISRELHDNVGSQLTYLVSTLDYLSYRLDQDHAEQYQELVEELSANTRATNAQLRETIWAINQQSISIGNFADKCRQHLSTVLNEKNGLNYSVKAELKDPEYQLNPMQAIHLFRIVQEAVNNTVKYAKANSLSITITLKNELILIIEDDGIGFEPDAIDGEHYGLQNMRTRAQEISGKATIHSSKSKGCRIEITIPVK